MRRRVGITVDFGNFGDILFGPRSILWMSREDALAYTDELIHCRRRIS